MTRSQSLSAVLAIILLVFIAVASVFNEAAIIDEPEHIAVGYHYFHGSKTNFNLGQAPLLKWLVGGALSFFSFNTGLVLPKNESLSIGANYGFQFLYDVGNDPRLILLISRLTTILFNALLLVALLRGVKKLYGWQITCYSFLLILVSPTFLAHFRYVTMDIPVALSVTLVLVNAAIVMKEYSRKNIFIFIASLLVALLVKFSSWFLVPVLLLAGCGLQLSPSLISKKYGSRLLLLLISLCAAGIIVIVGLSLAGHNLFFSNLITGVQQQLVRVKLGTLEKGYLGGILYSGGNLLYFPVLFILKEQVIWLFLLGVSFFYQSRTSKHISQNIFDILGVLWIISYALTSITSQINIGLRHLLPIYPSLCIIAASGIYAVIHQTSFLRKIVVFSCIAVVLNIVTYASAPLSYFNLLMPSKKPTQWLIDSNYDWGQDAIRLGQWITDNKACGLFIDYYGRGDPYSFLPFGCRYKLINEKAEKPAQGSLIAISVSKLELERSKRLEGHTIGPGYSYLEDLSPIDRVGKTIFIYRLPISRHPIPAAVR
jgi:hypothetical protein